MHDPYDYRDQRSMHDPYDYRDQRSLHGLGQWVYQYMEEDLKMKKFLAVVLSALLFGGVAGATIYGINNLTNGINEVAETTQPAEPSAQSQAETTSPNIDRSSIATTTAAISKTYSTKLDVSDIVEDAMPQVVSITNTMVIEQSGYSSLFDYFYGNAETREYEVPASGSGVILAETDDELLIVTNNHVVEDAKTLSITFVDGTSVDANLKGTDSSLDLAVVAVPLSDIPEETRNQIKVARYHDSDDLKVGQGVIAIGNALGYGQTVTVGYISALNREITAEGTVYSDLIQTDAAINPGNSGGALINMDGEIIGINVAKLSNTEVEGFGYSIPIYKVMDAIENLSNAKTRVELEENMRGRMGIYMNTISQQNATALGIPAGIIIKGFSDEYMEDYGFESVMESPARAAGLLKNDIITAVDGQSVKTAEELSSFISYCEKGSEVTVTYLRLENGTYNEHTANVTLGALDDPTIEPVNKDEIPEKVLKQGAEHQEEETPSTQPIKPADPKNAPDPNAIKPANPNNGNGNNQEPSTEAGNNDNGSDPGNADGNDNKNGNGYDTDDEIYELFREFIERYQ